jgi:phospholipid transport system substrate-binding protein
MKRSSATDFLQAVALVAGWLLPVASIAAEPFVGNEIVSGAAADVGTGVATQCTELAADHAAIVALIDNVIKTHFDLRLAARNILPEQWPKMSAAEQERFVNDFYGFLVAIYGDLLLYWRPDTLVVHPFEGEPTRSPAHVSTTLKLVDGTEVSVEFVMVRQGTDWRVVDILGHGVSEVRLFRSQFHDISAEGGIGSVFEWLERKAATGGPPTNPKQDCRAGGKGAGR